MSPAYPAELDSIGDHIRKRRLDLALLQKDVAKRIGVHKGTIINWERGHREPSLKHIPAIIRFLGYVPFEPGDSLPERLRAYRMIHGISRKELASVLEVDEGTLWRWETGQRRPAMKYAERVESVTASVRGIRAPVALSQSKSH